MDPTAGQAPAPAARARTGADAAHVEDRRTGLDRPCRQHRRERVLTQGEAAVVGSIADALVTKDRDVYFLCDRDGQIPTDGGHGFGLYYRDCRYLSGYEVRIADGDFHTLAGSARAPQEAVLLLTNPDIRLADGRLVPKETLEVSWRRRVDGSMRTLIDRFRVHNHGDIAFDCPIELRLAGGFEDVFAIRGLFDERLGTVHDPHWEDGTLILAYTGSDRVRRSVTVDLDPTPPGRDGTAIHARLPLPARGVAELTVHVHVHEEELADATDPVVPGGGPTAPDPGGDHWLDTRATVASDSLLLEQVVERSFRDLQALTTTLGGQRFFAAGVPWFVTLFGRDSLITALQVLAYERDIAAETLRLLARMQGTQVDDWRDEAPGKILHELRVGEYARLGEIPHTPYYGTVDATPLFLVLLARHAEWTGSLDLFEELRDSVEAALGWLDSEHADPTGRGFISYRSRTKRGLVNQAWKDSGTAIVDEDGALARPPLAVVEVQGYAFEARLRMARLFERAGDVERAAALRSAARTLRDRVEATFWDDDLGTYGLALQGDGRLARVASSNPGHLLWSGLPDPDRARRTAERLTAPDLWSGWGVRTLSSDAVAYNPIGYHLGTVWPHDNALIGLGLRRYGLDEPALRIFEALVEAATGFDGYRLPEAFAGFDRSRLEVPVRYPVACHPQAWAAGAVPALLADLLGLVPDGFARRLRVVRPVLPRFVDRVELHDVRVADARAALRFERGEPGEPTRVEVIGTEGDLEIEVEPTTVEGPAAAD